MRIGRLWQFFVVCVVFLAGFLFDRYKFPPYELFSRLRKTFSYTNNFNANAGASLELIDGAFSDPLIGGDKIYQVITNTDQLRAYNEKIFISIDQFYTSYKDMKIVDSSFLSLDRNRSDVTRVDYVLAGKSYESYSYGPIKSEINSKTAILIIPGSGFNQSSEIYNKKSDNYQYGILNALGPLGDAYIFIKPNEDILAFHDGSNKVSQEYYVNWHLNRGGSYSASYIAQSLGFVKFLKSKYEKVEIVGLSQGGRATLLNALQSEPDKAVVSSGYSILEDMVEGSGHNQIIIPGVSLIYNKPDLKKVIQSQKTSFLFSFGIQGNGIYQLEAANRNTCTEFGNLTNVKCVTFNGGHEFPIADIADFLKTPLDH